jgi:hypothetical protein
VALCLVELGHNDVGAGHRIAAQALHMSTALRITR